MITDDVVSGVSSYISGAAGGTAIATVTIQDRDDGADNVAELILVQEGGEPEEHEVIRGKYRIPVEVVLRTKPEGDEAAATHRGYARALAKILTDCQALINHLNGSIDCHDTWNGQGATEESDGYRVTTFSLDIWGGQFAL